jgi:inorganic triphosphatase YgiF
MTGEIELKLEVKPSQLGRLKHDSWLAQYASGPAEGKRLVSVYYDTDNLALRDQRATLRVRNADGEFIQTFKSERKWYGLGRLEWECPLKGPLPKLKHARKKRTDGVDLRALAGSLKPVFETVVQRHVMPLRYRGSRLELAIDHGEIKTGRRRLPIHEVEVELKRGKAGRVVAIGREIAEKFEASYGAASKAERGYALRERETGKPVCAQDIILSRHMTAAEAFQAVAMSCVHHFVGNRNAVIAGKAEGIHQMRVGLRRLRAALSIFKEMLRGPETEDIKKALKWLAEELSEARDMDVLTNEGIASIAKATAVPEAVKALKADVIDKRDEGFEAAKQAVAGTRFRQVVLDTVLWINGGRWTKSGVSLIGRRRGLSARRFAAQELGRRTRRVLKKLDKISELSPLKRHKLRIAVKKLRYATSFFGSLFVKEKKASKKFSAMLKGLQSSLGQLNDIRVHGKLANEYAAPRRGTRGAARRAFAMGELTGKERSRSRDLLKVTRHRGKLLHHCQLFWE